MGQDRRWHIASGLAAESLVDRALLERTAGRGLALLPELWLIAVGGSVFDAGAAPLAALAEAAAELSQEHTLALSCGGGVRERHTLMIGLDLGLPAGGLAAVAGAASEQNALLLWALLAGRNGVRLPQNDLELLPALLALGRLPVLTSFPPYEYWEFPPERNGLPPHGCDCGALLLAETLGCRLLLLKDVDGAYTADPRIDPAARKLPRLSAAELNDPAFAAGPLEPLFGRILARCRRVREVRLLGGLDPGPLRRRLAGGEPGTLLEAGHA